MTKEFIDIVLNLSYDDRIKIISILWSKTIRCKYCPFEWNCEDDKISKSCEEHVKWVIEHAI